MNLIQMFVRLIKAVKGITVQINMNGKEVDIVDLFEYNCNVKLTGRTAIAFIKEWNK